MGYEGKITFVRTNHKYDSYQDFWKLVELSGFPTIFVSELDVREDGVFIVSPMNGEWRPHIDNQQGRRNAYLILWNLERPVGSGGYIGGYARECHTLISQRHVDEVWVSDRKLAVEAGLRYVTLGSDLRLGAPSAAHKRYSFCHMSAPTPRRTTLWSDCQGESLSMGPNSWPPQRNEVLQGSSFGLNVHQDQHPYQEPLRLALFAAYGLPVLSEELIDAHPWDTSTIRTANYVDLCEILQQMQKDDYTQWRDMGLRGREMLCKQFQFGDVVKKALRESIGNWR